MVATSGLIWVQHLDWKAILSTVVAAVIGGVITAGALWIRESRRKISFAAKDLYFGPDRRNYNPFMGRNFPSEDRVGLEFEGVFFSNKSVSTGLHKFQIEFCRETYMGPIVEFEPEMGGVLKDLDRPRQPGQGITLSMVDLPSRQFVTMDIWATFGRDHWNALKSCTLVRLACETPEGRRKRFKLGHIRFPTMPPEGIRGLDYCQILVGPNAPYHKIPTKMTDDRAVIVAIKHQKPSAALQMPLEKDIRYWAGDSWCQSVSDAKVYAKIQAARSEGEAIKIWNNVPEEWL